MHFLQKLAKHILEDRKDELKDLIVILPNMRAKIFLNDHLRQLSVGATFLPRSYSSPELMEKLSGIQSADDYFLLSRLYLSYPKEKDEEFTFETFMNWGSSVLQDFKELDHQLVPAQKMFSELEDIRRIEFWHPQQGELSDFQKKYLKFCNKLHHIYKNFCNSMEKDGMGHIGYAERLAYDGLDSNIFSENAKIIIAGFNALTKAEEEIFKFISKTFHSQFFWDYDHYYFDNQIHEAGHFARLNQQRFTKDFNWISEDYKEIDKNISVFKCATSFEQSFVVSEILNSIGEINPKQTAIILPDESLLLPVLQALPDKIKDVNVTMGYPLYHSPYYSLFEEIFKLYFNSRNKNDGILFYHKDVFRFLNSDGIKEIAGKKFATLIQPFLEMVMKNNQVFIQASSLNNLFNQVFTERQIDFTKGLSSMELMQMLQNIIFNLDSILSHKEQIQNKISREFLLHHFEVVNQVKEMIKNLNESLDTKALHKIWKHYSKLSKVQFTGEPLSGIQVMGLLESRNLDFEHVIILSANEGTLPSEKRYGSLIPNDIKRIYGMHLHREKDAVISYHFYRLLQRAKRIDLLYSSQTDNLGGGEKSRYIVQLEKELPEHNPKSGLKHFDVLSTIPIGTSKLLSIERTDYIKELILKKFESGLSPTSLNTYIRCPLDFYFMELVGLKYQDDLIENIEANILGSAVHSTLEALYQPFIGKIISVEDVGTMKKRLNEYLKNAFGEYLSDEYLFNGKNLLDFRIAERLLLRFLDKEENYVSEHKIKIVELEARVEKNIEIEWNGQSYPVKIKGFIDRVEEKDGLLNLVDYKTGNIKDNELNISHISEAFEGKEKMLQMLVYTWLYPNNQKEKLASIGSLKKYNHDYIPLKIEGEEIISQKTLEEFESTLTDFILTILKDSKDLSHKEDSLYCGYC